MTRTTEGNVEEKRKLEKLGAKVIDVSLIEIRALRSFKRLDNSLERILEFDWIIFTSANGVKAVFERAAKIRVFRENKIIDRLVRSTKVRFACVGPSTREELKKWIGKRWVFTPKEFLTEDLAVELVKKFNIRRKKILLARARVANRAMAKILLNAGAIVEEVSVYDTAPLRRKLKGALLDRVTDITLTSPSTVEGLLGAFTLREISSRNLNMHCIGPVTSRRAIKHGLKVSSVARIHTLEGLINELVRYYKKSSSD